jgi:uncharacterized protein (TIGR03086 family)
MAELIELFGTGIAVFGERVEAADEGQWGAPTPDDEWTVADLVRHLVDEHRWFPPLLHGHDLTTAEEIVAGTRNNPDDPAAEWSEASIASLDAVRELGVLDRKVELSRGQTPAPAYICEMITDLTIHSWDLQAAIGFNGALPADLVGFALEQVDHWGDMSGSGMFKAPLPPQAGDDPLDRLLRLTGRDPHWSPPPA